MLRTGRARYTLQPETSWVSGVCRPESECRFYPLTVGLHWRVWAGCDVVSSVLWLWRVVRRLLSIQVGYGEGWWWPALAKHSWILSPELWLCARWSHWPKRNPPEGRWWERLMGALASPAWAWAPGGPGWDLYCSGHGRDVGRAGVPSSVRAAQTPSHLRLLP